jgi:hypothetical protein
VKPCSLGYKLSGDDDLLCAHAVGLLMAGQQLLTEHIKYWALIGESVGGWLELIVLSDGKLQVGEVNALTRNDHGM